MFRWLIIRARKYPFLMGFLLAMCLCNFLDLKQAVSNLATPATHRSKQTTPTRATGRSVILNRRLRKPRNHTGLLVERQRFKEKRKKPKSGINAAYANLVDIPIHIEGKLHAETLFTHVYDPLKFQKPIEFLPNYRNPCFWQELQRADVYEDLVLDDKLTSDVTDALTNIYQQRLGRGEHARLRCFPSFIVAGVQKCGTTELQAVLPTHHQVANLTIKENHWWNRGRFRASGPGKERVPLEGYLALFDLPAEEIRNHVINYSEHGSHFHPLITGEVSPALLWDQLFWRQDTHNRNLSEPRVLTPHVIHFLLPRMKFIIMLRDPTARLYSDWLYFDGRGKDKTTTDFHVNVRKAIQWFDKCLEEKPFRACFYDPLKSDAYTADRRREGRPWYHPAFRLRMGMYSVFIKDLLDDFPRDQVLIMRLEDYSADKDVMQDQIFTFLGLDSKLPPKNDTLKIRNHNEKGYAAHGKMLPETKQLLDSFYTVYNKQLADLLADDRFLWNS